MGGILLCFGSGFVLRFHHDRGAARRGYEDVGVLARVGREGLGVLGEYLTARHHATEEVAEGVVDVGFDLVGHVRDLRDGAVVDLAVIRAAV